MSFVESLFYQNPHKDPHCLCWKWQQLQITTDSRYFWLETGKCWRFRTLCWATVCSLTATRWAFFKKQPFRSHMLHIVPHVLRLGFKISEQHLTSKWGHDSHDPSTHQVQQPDGTQRFEGTQTGTYDDNPVKAGRGDGVGIAGNGWFAVCSWGLREFLLIFGLACITGKGGKRMNGWEVTVHFVQCFSLIQRLWHLMQLWKSFLKWWWICWGLWQSSDVFGRP